MMKTKLSMSTCYDASFARLCAKARCLDYVLVGDSVGMVVYGEDSTLNVDLEMMRRHVAAVKRGFDKSKVETKDLPEIVGDLPVGTYESPSAAIISSSILRSAGAEIIKVEGPVFEQVKALKEEGFRVCGHLGLTPQSIQTFKVQGREPEQAKQIFSDAKKLQDAGCEMIVLEMLPRELAKQITEELSIPSIGIGAGVHCSGQVLVLYDLLGMDHSFSPKFLKRFLDGEALITKALQSYCAEVSSGAYPDEHRSFGASKKPS